MAHEEWQPMQELFPRNGNLFAPQSDEQTEPSRKYPYAHDVHKILAVPLLYVQLPQFRSLGQIWQAEAVLFG